MSLFATATTDDLKAMEARLTKLISQAVPPSGLRWATNQDADKIINRMSQLDDAITALQAEVTQETTVEKSALALIQGIPAMIESAITAALAAGATPAQLQAITDVAATINANDTELAAAVAAGTPSAPAAAKKK